MLRFIIGRSGSGKTTAARKVLENISSTGGEPVLLIPEQYSFYSEKALLRALGPQQAARIAVLSFSRLAHTVLREVGDAGKQPLDKSGRILCMHTALQGLREQLTLYAPARWNAAFMQSLLQTVQELKHAAVSPEMLLTMGRSLAGETLRQKTKELSLILQAYEAQVAQSFLDPQDELARLCDCLQTTPFFAGKTVVIDAFSGFSGAELKVLEQILKSAEDIYITLCCDSIYGVGDGLGLFAPVQHTAAQLMTLAKQQGVKVASPLHCDENHRMTDADLRFLERSLFAAAPGQFPERPGHVTLFSAANLQSECEAAALLARKLVREEGLRYRDITFMVRDLERYRAPLQWALRQYELPVFCDFRTPVITQPLFRFVLAALEAATAPFGTESLLRMLKTGLTRFTTEEIGLVEEYVWVWQINGLAWTKPWHGHPDAFAGALTPRDEALLARVNTLRAGITAPLQQLREACRDARGETVAAALFRLLEAYGVPEGLRRLAASLEEAGEAVAAGQQERIWDLLMHILQQSAVVLRDQPLSLREYGPLFHLMAAFEDLGSIPQGLDEIALGAADRIRPENPKAVFILGANDGVFPAFQSPGGLFTDHDRARLVAEGFPLPDPFMATAEEYFLAYTCLCSASERLFLAYARADAGGNVLPPSLLVAQLRQLFPALSHMDADRLSLEERLEGERSAFALLAANWQSAEPLPVALKAHFAGDPGYAQKMESLRRIQENRPAQLRDRQAARDLFGEHMLLSASRVETYFQCPFRYFCQYGLGVRPRRRAELDALQTGTVLHYCLEHMLRRHGGKGLGLLTPQAISRELHDLLDQYLETYMGTAELPARFLYLYARLAKPLQEVVVHLAREFAQSEFEPAFFEMSIAPQGEVSPLTISLPEGGSLRIVGQVDRVDILQKEERTYVRVVDYKSGGKQFRLSDLFYGLNMQMLLYLMCLCQGESRVIRDPVPAGILYMPTLKASEKLPREADAESIRKAKDKALKMNGLILDNTAIIQGMEADGKGIFIPARLKSGGETAGTLISLAELGRLGQKTESLLRQMAAALQGGQIAALPAQNLYLDSCQYCDYRAACGREGDGPSRPIPLYKHEEALARLKEEGEEGLGN